jgi:hypothetical protein
VSKMQPASRCGRKTREHGASIAACAPVL